jgi:hypothetical protein
MESDPELTYPSNHTGEKPAKHESTQLLYAALFSTPDFRNTEAESVWSHLLDPLSPCLAREKNF